MYSKTLHVSAIVLKREVRETLEMIYRKKLADITESERVLGVAVLAALGKLGV